MKKMYVEPMGGMGNRFNCIISAIIISRKYDYKLYIIWNRDLGCAIKLSQLIEAFSNVKVYELYRMGYRRILGFMTMFSTLFCQHIMNKCDITLDEQYMRGKYQNLMQTEKDELFKNECIYISTSCGWVDNEGFESVRKEIIPKSEYIAIVDNVLKNINQDKLYGFHIRRTDHVVSIKNCPTILFTNKMDELICQDPEVVFYVATDDYKLEEELKEKYGNYILERKSFSRQVARNTKSGMMDAFVDILCLSKCKKIFGSESTFSTLAAYLGNTELEMMEIHKEKDANKDTI